MALTTSTLDGALPLISRGKVRDNYSINDSTLLMVATDRISAYDQVLATGIPDKGRLLTLLSKHFFDILTAKLPDLRTHFLTLDLPAQIPPKQKSVFERRSMQVRKLKIFPVEAIVRGYITGSALEEYNERGTVHGIPMREGIKASEKFPEPLFTPSTKAPPGEHDENVHPSKVPELISTIGGTAKHAARIEELSLSIYKVARAYALERGIVIADTKFEFGLDETTDEVVLVDEVLTPDSSRFWAKSELTVGKTPQSLDKQFLRDWLGKEGLKGKEGVEIPDEVVKKTWERYKEVYERLLGQKWESGGVEEVE